MTFNALSHNTQKEHVTEFVLVMFPRRFLLLISKKYVYKKLYETHLSLNPHTSSMSTARSCLVA